MSTGTADGGGTVGCEYCGREFGDERERAYHWFCEHANDLTEEQWKVASEERIRRSKRDEFPVTVDVVVPQEVWPDVVEYDLGGEVDPESVGVDDVSDDALIDLVATEFNFRVEGRD